MMEKIPVTKPFLPPIDEMNSLIAGVWERNYLTNNGPLLQRLESLYSEKNGVSETIAVTNGTVAIEIALEALDIHGEVITTPFTFPATSSAIMRTGNKPVFVDIDPETWNIDPDAVEAAVTEKTAAILGVHVFSAPCDVERIAEIAQKHRLNVIYDAAHCSFVKCRNRSIFEWGDVSTVSFHATKLFHTVEGGACFANDPNLRRRIREIRAFGFDDAKRVTITGTNAKMTEVHAAAGLACLNHIDTILERRKRVYEIYRNELNGAELTFQKFDPNEYNYSYVPVLFRNETVLFRVLEKLNAAGIEPRRYFWPILTDNPLYADAKRSGSLSRAADVSSRILCLPTYCDLQDDTVVTICGRIKDALQ